mgnify:CR=1 FL=1
MTTKVARHTGGHPRIGRQPLSNVRDELDAAPYIGNR